MNLKNSFLVKSVSVGTTIGLFGSSFSVWAGEFSFFKDIIRSKVLNPLYKSKVLTSGNDFSEEREDAKDRYLWNLVDRANSFDKLLAILSFLPEESKVKFSAEDVKNKGENEAVASTLNKNYKESVLVELNAKISENEWSRKEFLEAIAADPESLFSKFFKEKAMISDGGVVVLKREDLEIFDGSVCNSIFQDILEMVKFTFNFCEKEIKEKVVGNEEDEKATLEKLGVKFSEFELSVKKDYSESTKEQIIKEFDIVLNKAVDAELFFYSCLLDTSGDLFSKLKESVSKCCSLHKIYLEKLSLAGEILAKQGLQFKEGDKYNEELTEISSFLEVVPGDSGVLKQHFGGTLALGFCKEYLRKSENLVTEIKSDVDNLDLIINKQSLAKYSDSANKINEA